mgnify:CR=1 FL=1
MLKESSNNNNKNIFSETTSLEKAKMIRGNFNSKDFLRRYAVVRNNERNFLQASFEEDTVMSQFVESSIKFIGRI